MNLFIKANTKTSFLNQLQSGNINGNQVAFILDTHEIWTQGLYFPCPYSKNEIDTLISNNSTAVQNEVLRAVGVETKINDAVGLNSGAYSNTGTYIGKLTTNTVTSDIKALDTAVAGITSITNAEIDSIMSQNRI